MNETTYRVSEDLLRTFKQTGGPGSIPNVKYMAAELLQLRRNEKELERLRKLEAAVNYQGFEDVSAEVEDSAEPYADRLQLLPWVWVKPYWSEHIEGRYPVNLEKVEAFDGQTIHLNSGSVISVAPDDHDFVSYAIQAWAERQANIGRCPF